MSTVVRDARLPMAAAIYGFIISGVAFQLVPLLISALTRDLNLSATQVGSIPAFELGGLTLANVVGAWLIRTHSWKVLFTLGWTFWVAGNVVSAASADAPTLLALRCVVGIGGGLLSAVSTAALARAASPERAFAASAVAQAVLGAACTLAAPTLLAAGSWSALYLLLGALGVPGLFLARAIATLAANRAAEQGSEVRYDRSLLSARILLGPVGVLLSYVAMSTVWTYYGQIGEAGGATTAAIASALSLGAISGLVTSLLVTAVGSKVPRGVALLASLILTCGGVYLAFSSSGSWMFAASVLLWTCGTNIFTPYAYGATAAADPTGSSTALASAVSGAGFALGPLLAVPFIESGGIGGVRWLAWPFLVAGFIALALLLQRIRVHIPAIAQVDQRQWTSSNGTSRS